MREIDTTLNRLICAGEDLSDHWPLKTRAVVKMLEKKEVYCSWFQLNGGTVEDQIPALRVSDKYYTMPLRIQKSIFRHMRLHASFVNRERTATGVEKLRIPITLLREKMRTARRFMIMRKKTDKPAIGTTRGVSNKAIAKPPRSQTSIIPVALRRNQTHTTDRSPTEPTDAHTLDPTNDDNYQQNISLLAAQYRRIEGYDGPDGSLAYNPNAVMVPFGWHPRPGGTVPFVPANQGHGLLQHRRNVAVLGEVTNGSNPVFTIDSSRQMEWISNYYQNEHTAYDAFVRSMGIPGYAADQTLHQQQMVHDWYVHRYARQDLYEQKFGMSSTHDAGAAFQYMMLNHVRGRR
ncbi:hypothetical protein T484DRAFT_1755055 [Baffinella frigidus]|nr:hypothetical protein T484DRAFT_1755055 [Cryptophyta sp. CCMP2293]